MSSRPSRYLIFGASGFLGSHLLRALDARPGAPEVLAVSRSRRPADLGKQGRFVSMNLSSASTHELSDLLTVFAPDVVVNCAGVTHGTPKMMWDVNATFVERLVTALRTTPSLRFIHLGSASEYGDQPLGRPVAESAQTRPITTYGRSKLAGTRAVTRAASNDGLRAITLRVFNPVGAHQPANTLAGHAATEMRCALESGASSITLGPLDAERDFLAATDVASAILRAATALLAVRETRPAAVLNVGRGQAVSCRGLVEELASVARFNGQISTPGHATSSSAGVSSLFADPSQLLSELSWVPDTPLDLALEELWLGDCAKILV
jgi:nucleoside-diphosphate-sugar epimerase